MSLLDVSTQVYTQLPKLFETLRSGQAPDKFTRQFLKDIGFKSSNHHAFIPLLKGLGFLTADGSPTPRYKEFLDKTRWKRILAEAVKESYSDIFVLKAEPTDSDRDLVAGKFKSTYNHSDLVADRAARTFLALVNLADKDVLFGKKPDDKTESKAIIDSTEEQASQVANEKSQNGAALSEGGRRISELGLHYNFQIHLPATKDIEIYNAIFKSMREHFID